MDLETLTAAGAQVSGGQVDLNGVNIGVMLKDGTAALTPEGEEAVAAIVAAAAAIPAPKAPAKKTAKKAVEEPAAPVAEVPGTVTNDLIGTDDA